MRKEIHLANSVQELNYFAEKDIKYISPDKLCNSAEKIFQKGLQYLNDEDEEPAYILFVRFKLIYEYLDKINDNKCRTKQRLGREYTTVTKQLKKLETSLRDRYLKEKYEEIITTLSDPPKTETKSSTSLINFPSGYISCNELYKLIQEKVQMVILDTRPRDNYLQSSMKHPCCVNIPEEIIQSGASANTLGKKVPNDSRAQWDKRWDVDITIILDWASTKDTITASKLSVLKDILILWDTTMLDNYPLVVLNGGYLEWLQMYPMLCSNPDVVYEIQNSALNELLDLDLIEYPSAEETVPIRYLKPPSLQPVINRATKPANINNKDKNIVKQDDSYVNLDELRAKRNLEAEEGMRLELQQREQKLLEDKVALEKSKEELNKENEELRKKIQNFAVNNKPNNIPFNEEVDIRKKLLQEAREKKKNLIIPDSNIYNVVQEKLSEFDKKTRHLGKHVVDPGLTGLVNLGFTCYMNSVIQCFSNTRLLHDFFVLGECLGRDSYGDIANEFRNLIQRIWSGRCKTISPTKFKLAVDRHGPRYKGRDQQDAHEFLISLTNWLHDDLKTDIKRPFQVVWTPRQRNWMSCTEGKTSVILETFCGQQMNVITCDECKKKREKLELFENLTLALPNSGSCTLEACLEQFFSKQLIEDYNCNTCKSNKLVNLEVKLVSHPPVLVFCLKRFTEVITNGQYNFIKNVVTVNYPLNNLKLFGVTYNLYSVIVHRTATLTLNSGHYFAICKNVRTGKWYKFDDQCVSQVSNQDAIEPNDAYILFYQMESEEHMAQLQFNY